MVKSNKNRLGNVVQWYNVYEIYTGSLVQLPVPLKGGVIAGEIERTMPQGSTGHERAIREGEDWE